VIVVFATEVASIITVSAAGTLAGAVYVAVKGVVFVSVPQSAKVQVGGFVEVSLNTCQVTPELVMSFETVAVNCTTCEASTFVVVAGTSAMVSVPLLLPPPWQPARIKIAASAGARCRRKAGRRSFARLIVGLVTVMYSSAARAQASSPSRRHCLGVAGALCEASGDFDPSPTKKANNVNNKRN
jgi:hypothetical protein